MHTSISNVKKSNSNPHETGSTPEYFLSLHVRYLNWKAEQLSLLYWLVHGPSHVGQ